MGRTSNEVLLSVGALKKRRTYGLFLIVLVLAAPLGGRVVGTAWGAISAYCSAIAMFHKNRIAMGIAGQVLKDSYERYVYGK